MSNIIYYKNWRNEHIQFGDHRATNEQEIFVPIENKNEPLKLLTPDIYIYRITSNQCHFTFDQSNPTNLRFFQLLVEIDDRIKIEMYQNIYRILGKTSIETGNVSLNDLSDSYIPPYDLEKNAHKFYLEASRYNNDSSEDIPLFKVGMKKDTNDKSLVECYQKLCDGEPQKEEDIEEKDIQKICPFESCSAIFELSGVIINKNTYEFYPVWNILYILCNHKDFEKMIDERRLYYKNEKKKLEETLNADTPDEDIMEDIHDEITDLLASQEIHTLKGYETEAGIPYNKSMDGYHTTILDSD